MSEEKKTQVKSVWKQKKTWAAILSGATAVVIGVFGKQLNLTPDVQKVIIGVVAFIGSTFIGAEQWKDGKVISAKIFAEAQTAMKELDVGTGSKEVKN